MNPEKTVRQIIDEWNAKAKAAGQYLDRDPWSIPPAQGSLFDVPEAAAAQARVALLQQQIADLQRQPQRTAAGHAEGAGEDTPLVQAPPPKKAVIEAQPQAPDHA
jgi:hypothetical protein